MPSQPELFAIFDKLREKQLPTLSVVNGPSSEFACFVCDSAPLSLKQKDIYKLHCDSTNQKDIVSMHCFLFKVKLIK